MLLVKIMKRKDASSVLVAIVIAMAVGYAIQASSYDVATRVANWGQSNPDGTSFYYGGGGWRYSYLQPLVSLVFQLVIFELLAWVYVYGSRFLSAGLRSLRRGK